MKRAVYLIICLGMALVIVCSSAEENCLICHGKQAPGVPHLSSAEIQAQMKMPATCTDCHKGNPRANTAQEAHRGLLSVTAINRSFKPVKRAEMSKEDLEHWKYIEPRGKNRATQLMPKKAEDEALKDNPEYRTVIWHDKNPGTLAFNPVHAMETCGKCHPEQVKSFLKTPMGGAGDVHVHHQYLFWAGPAGPQSCGLWVGALAKPEQGSFIDKNIKIYNAHSTKKLTAQQAYDSQRRCNQCHVGCLNCHYAPEKNKTHTFIRKPSALSCYGGGASFSCHAGPLERRRGDGYLRAEFTQAAPEGIEMLKKRQDIHMQRGIVCVDCHEQNKRTGYHADLRRDVDCAKCHAEVVKAHAKGLHRQVDCASCHTTMIGGYAFNFWSAVGPSGKENPITRIQDYMVAGITPLIIRNPKNIWIPVHPVPHTSGNVKRSEVKISKRLLFRNKPDVQITRRYFSNDSYAVTGLIKGLDEKDNDTMVWLNLDRVAHAAGKSRSCESCHTSTAQRIAVTFSGGSYKDVEDGSYTIIADEKGLRVIDFKNSEGRVPKGLEPLKDKWVLHGNFALPELKDRRSYEQGKSAYERGKFTH